MSGFGWRTGFAVTTILAFGMGSGARADDLTVRTTGGAVRGIATANAREFLGIPYAAPPVGALRWRAPQPASWSGVLPANTLQSPCPQPASDFGVASSNENCLYLNVYAPLSASGKLPVMVWIHGGAFVTGTGDEYDGSALVQNGVIVVTINYRLGYFGFLANPALDAESPGHASGDYGLMDQQAALRWVKANAASFGGDPRQVTVFGESAGGQSVFDQLVSPGATGLFQRAIIESGAYAVTLPTLAAADASGTAFANAVGCTNTTDAGCLRALPVSTILAQEAASGAQGSLSQTTQFEPNVGTNILPAQPLLAIAFGAFNRVPVLQGSNHDEGRLFTALEFDTTGAPLMAAEYETALASLVGIPIAPYAAALYPLADYASPDLAYSAVFTDAVFACSALGFNQLLSFSVPTYAYEFADENAARLSLPNDPFMPLGAPHSSELPFLWPNLIALDATGATMTAGEQQLATQMRAAWTNFARAGNPNGPGVTPWPAFRTASSRLQELVPGTPYVSTSFSAYHKCDFWEPALTLGRLAATTGAH